MFTNAQILAAVLNHWAQPALQVLLGGKLSNIPFLANIEAKIKSTGWVSPMWNLGSEIVPLLRPVSSKLVEPFLANYLNNVPDSYIPELAHGIVDGAIEKGSLSFFEGNIQFEREDLQELKKLLMYNLPIKETTEKYTVICEEPNPQGKKDAA